MKIKRHFTLIFCFLLISNYVISQQISILPSDTAQYLFSQFTDGTILLKGGKILTGKLNYNTCLNQMQFLGTNNEILSLAEPEKVIKVVITNRIFINVKNNFVEFISEGPVFLFLRVHKNRIAEKIGAYGTTGSGSSISTTSSFRVDDRDINNLSINEKISYHKDLVFYVLNNGIIRVVENQNDLLRCFSSKKELIKQELVSQHTKFNSIESMKKIINWINANGIKD